MLIEFRVGNYRSFNSPQVLSLAAGSGNELQKENSFEAPCYGLPRLLRSAVVYGPNAAGKSNLIRAAGFMKNMVLSSAKGSQADEPIGVTPFLHDPEGRAEPCEFEMIFIEDQVRYQYGFEVTAKRVTHEWLLAYPESRAQRWFEREYDFEAGTDKWYFGSKFKGQRKVWQEATRANALFLSTAIQLNSEQLQPVFNWFKRMVVITQNAFLSPSFTVKQCEEPGGKEKILRILKTADPSIADIEFREDEFSLNSLPSDMPDDLKEKLTEELVDKKTKKIFFLHHGTRGDQRSAIEWSDESGGTRKLFSYAGSWLEILNNGRVLWADELETSFHPLMIRFLVKLLNNPKTNTKNAQLVFTTHNTSLLDQDLLRRDQVWFMEKDECNGTQLYPLSDFSPRKGEALEKGYLHGRYGALPYIGEVWF